MEKNNITVTINGIDTQKGLYYNSATEYTANVTFVYCNRGVSISVQQEIPISKSFFQNYVGILSEIGEAAIKLGVEDGQEAGTHI